MTTGRRRGRPRVTEPRSTLTTWVPVSKYDELRRLAAQRRVSVSAVLRSLLSNAIRPPKDRDS